MNPLRRVSKSDSSARGFPARGGTPPPGRPLPAGCRQRRRGVAGRGVSSADAAAPGGDGPAESGAAATPPWAFGFQCNERYLDWDDSAQRRLVQLVASKELGLSTDQLAQRMLELSALLPDLVGRMARMKADLLVKLLTSPARVSEKLIALRDALPGMDVSELVAGYPRLVTDFSAEEIRARVDGMQAALPGVDVAGLLAREPRLISVDLGMVVGEIERLMGPGVDPVAVLVSQPELVLSMEQSGLESAIDFGNEEEEE